MKNSLILFTTIILLSGISVSAKDLIIYLKNGSIKRYPITEISKMEFSRDTAAYFKEIRFSEGYHVRAFPVGIGYPYIAEFDFYDDMTRHFFSAGFRKEGTAGVHRDLEIQIDPRISMDRYAIAKYTGVIGRSDYEFPLKRSKGWRKVELVLKRNGYKVYLDGELVSQGLFTFIPDKVWFRSGLGGNIPQVGGHYYNGVNIVRIKRIKK